MKGNLSNGEFKNGCRVLPVVVASPAVVDAVDAVDVAAGGDRVVAGVLWRRVPLWTLRLLPLVCLFFVLPFPFLAGARVVTVGRPEVDVAAVLDAIAAVAVAAVALASAAVAVAAVVDFAIVGVAVGSCLNAGTVLLAASSSDNSIPSSSSKSLSNLLISYLSIKGASFSVVVDVDVLVVLVVPLVDDDMEEAVELLTL